MKYRFVNSNIVIEMTEEVANSVNRTNQVFMSSEKEFKSLLEMKIYGCFYGITSEMTDAYVKVCEELAKFKDEDIQISDKNEIFYDLFVPS